MSDTTSKTKKAAAETEAASTAEDTPVTEPLPVSDPPPVEPAQEPLAAEATPQEQDPAAPRMSRERLLTSDAEGFTGYQPFIVAGALHDVEGDDFTAAEVKALCEAWLQREVATDPVPEEA